LDRRQKMEEDRRWKTEDGRRQKIEDRRWNMEDGSGLAPILHIFCLPYNFNIKRKTG